MIPPGHSTGTPSPIRGTQGKEQESREPPETTPTRRAGGQGRRTAFKSPHPPDQESQREERDSVIDAVKQITGAQSETPGQGRVTVGDTPEYHWDTGYDGIQGFSSRLRNRVSETSTPQGGQSPRGGPRTPPEPQRQFKQLKVYDETPAGRPFPTLQQIRQANLRKIFEEEGVDTPCDFFVGALTMIIGIALKRPIGNPKMLGRVLLREGVLGASAQIVISLTQVYVLVHGAINRDI